MLNTTVKASVNNGYYVTTLYITQSEKNIETNQSKISYRLTTAFTAGSGAWNNPPYGLTGRIIIGGKTITIAKTPYNFNTNKNITWAEGSFWLAHNADGTKKITASFNIYPDNDYFSNSSASSPELTLETIPRASDFSFNETSSQLDSEFMITLKPASNSFTHKVYLKIGSKSVHTNDMAAGATQQSITPSTDDWQDLFSGTSTTATVTVETFNGNTKLGSKSRTITITSNPNNAKPGLGISVTTVNGISGKYFKGITAMKVVLSPTYRYGSKYKSFSVTIKNGSNVIYSGSSGNFTTPVYSVTGAVTITASVTDTRGYIGSTSTTVTYIDHFKPYVSVLVNKRVNASGSDDMLGSYSLVGGTVVFKHNVGNKLSYKVEYKERDSNSWIQVFDQTGITTNTYNKTQRISTSSEKTYDLRITLSDGISTNTYNYVIQTGLVILDIHKSGKGIGIGKSAEKQGYVLINDEFPTQGGKCVYLGQNDNLNDIIDMGMYYNSADIYATKSNNYPFQQAGLLEVFINESGRGMIAQRYTTYSNHHIYYRVRYSSKGWQPWQLLSGRLGLSQNEIVKSTQQTIFFTGAVQTSEHVTITFETTPISGMRSIMWLNIPPQMDIVGQVRRWDGSDLTKPLDAILFKNGQITLFTNQNFNNSVKVTFTYPY